MKSAKCRPPTTAVVLPDDLIAELLSFLPVKIILQFRCVSKSWKALISDPIFVKLHLNRSASRNPQFTLVTRHAEDLEDGYTAAPFIQYWLHLWNPATRTNEKFECFRGYCCPQRNTFQSHDIFKFKFGFDNATNTYKVVAFRYNPEHHFRSNVKIVSLHDNVWRDIESFPVVPLHLDNDGDHAHQGVYLSGTFNWLAIQNEFHYNFKDIKVDQFVIVSLDLGTETYNKYMLPRGFDEVPHVEPTIGVLGGCLCFSYSKDTYFVIWRMMKFQAEDSWTQFLKLSYQDLQIDYTYSYYETFQLVSLLLYEDGHTLILKSNYNKDAIIYNWRHNKVGRTEITTSSEYNSTCWYSTMDYVESLVSIF